MPPRACGVRCGWWQEHGALVHAGVCHGAQSGDDQTPPCLDWQWQCPGPAAGSRGSPLLTVLFGWHPETPPSCVQTLRLAVSKNVHGLTAADAGACRGATGVASSNRTRGQRPGVLCAAEDPKGRTTPPAGEPANNTRLCPQSPSATEARGTLSVVAASAVHVHLPGVG